MEPKPFANDTFIQRDMEVRYITEASGALTFEDGLTDHCLFAAGVVFTYLHLCDFPRTAQTFAHNCNTYIWLSQKEEFSLLSVCIIWFLFSTFVFYIDVHMIRACNLKHGNAWCRHYYTWSPENKEVKCYTFWHFMQRWASVKMYTNVMAAT